MSERSKNNVMMDSKKVKWFQPNQIGLVQGAAVARNLMFENKADHELFLRLFDRYVGPMAELIQYNLNATCWMLLLRFRDQKTIRRAYLKQRSKSAKANPESTLTDVSRMISEHFRLFLSRFVFESNKMLNKQGTRVKHRFQKYEINQSSTYIASFKQLSQRIEVLEQRLEKYRADKRAYNTLENETSKNPVWKTGNWMYKHAIERHAIVDNFLIINPINSVLRKLFKYHKTTKLENNPP